MLTKLQLTNNSGNDDSKILRRNFYKNFILLDKIVLNFNM